MMGILSDLFSGKPIFGELEFVLAELAKDPHPLPAYIHDLRYAKVLAYAQEVGDIQKQSGQFIKFDTEIDGTKYRVTLTRRSGESGSTLTSNLS